MTLVSLARNTVTLRTEKLIHLLRHSKCIDAHNLHMLKVTVLYHNRNCTQCGVKNVFNAVCVMDRQILTQTVYKERT